MVDASHHALSDNMRMTRTIVDMAHASGVPVEGELGYVPGVEGEDAERHPGGIAFTTVVRPGTMWNTRAWTSWPFLSAQCAAA
ncbi:MAG: class II fructose-bisphosphate aldolase [Pseudomonadota bacterium]